MKPIHLTLMCLALLGVLGVPVVASADNDGDQASIEGRPDDGGRKGADAEPLFESRPGPILTLPAPPPTNGPSTTAPPTTTTVPPTTVPPTTLPPTTVPPTTVPSTSTTTPPSTAPSTTTPPTTAPPPTTPPEEPPDGVLFFEDFADNGSLARFDFEIYHRDDFVNADNLTWPGDHAVVGPNDVCGPPEEKRVVNRGDRADGFNDEWIYRCAPGGDVGKAHLMTSIGDTSGYSIGAFAPKQSFRNVREVRWDVNITELGNRQFPEVKLIPVNTFDFQNLPCAIEWLPCDTDLHRQLGSLGVSFMNHEMTINDGNDSQSLTPRWGDHFLNPGDPAVDSIRIRRTHVFRDNGNGTLSFGIEQEDGSFHTVSRPGSFPTGPIRVVFADHNYTPLKAENGRPSTFTWHWDNLTVLG